MPARRLGPYAIEAVLGRGGMGTVYRARLLEPRCGRAAGDSVALKVLHRDLLTSAAARRRFDREVRVGCRIAHPNVVRAYGRDTFEEAGATRHALLMEFVEGQTLDVLLAEGGPLPEALVRAIGRDLACGLAALHAAGVVHRDVKPQNVLLTPRHEVKITDFGLAHLQDEVIRLTRTQGFEGSIEYAAPEQFGRRRGAPDGRTDLWAAGLVLYELVTGRHPFRTDPPVAVLRRILEEDAPPAATLNPRISRFFDGLLAQLLAKDPGERLPSAESLRLALEEGEAGTWWRTHAAEVLRPTPPIRRFPPVRRETVLVGRDGELAFLDRLLARAREGEGQVVLLRGEAGVGKTRLADAFARSLGREDAAPVAFLCGSYAPAGITTVHGAFSTAFREYLGGGDLRPALGRIFGDRWYLLPAFEALLTGEPLPPGAESMPPRAMHAAFAAVTRKLSLERPLVLLIDDLHHAPAEGRVLFAALAGAVQEQRVLLIGCARRRLPAAWVAELRARPHVHELELERLGPADLHHLLEEVLCSPSLVRDLEPTVALKSEGNPYFALEILRSLRDRGRIERRADGAWRPRGRIDAVEIPSSLHELLRSRFAELEPQDRDLLEVAACLGHRFDPLLVADVAGVGRMPALRALARLEREHRLVRADGRRFVFDHHQLMEVLYADLAPLLREAYHAAIARALEQGTAEGDDESTPGARAAEVCRHGLRGRLPATVEGHLDAALSHLEEGHLVGDACALAHEALEVPGFLEGERRLALLLRQNNDLGLAGRRDAQEAALEEAAAVAAALPEAARPLAVLDVVLARAHLAFDCGRIEEAVARFEEARRTARAAAIREGEGRAEAGLGLAAYRRGRFEVARDHFRAAHAAATEAGRAGAATTALGNLGVVLQQLGEREEALHCLERVMAHARATGNLRLEGKTCDNLGILYSAAGRIDAALASYRRSVRLADAVGDRPSQAVGRVNLGSVLREQDRFEEAIPCFEAALAISTEVGDPVNQAIALDNLAMVDLALGDAGRARERLEAALALCRAVGSTHDEAYVLENMAWLAEEEGRLEDARGHLDRAVDLRRDSSSPVGEAATRAMRGSVRAALGDAAGAAEDLDTAIALATRHDAPTVLVRATAVRATLPGGDVDEALGVWERLGARALRQDALFALVALGEAAGRADLLAEARRLLEARIANAPASRREAMRSLVALHRRILASASPAPPH